MQQTPDVIAMGIDTNLASLVSDRVGLIRHLVRLEHWPDQPERPILARAIAAASDVNSDPMDIVGCGRGATRLEAAVGAVGEALERYCAMNPDRRRLHRGRYSDISADIISPTEFVLYSWGQYQREEVPYCKFHPDEILTWYPATSLPDGGQVFVPAGLVFLRSNVLAETDSLCQRTSNGLATGSTLAEAVLNGIYEVLERDAFMIAWLNRLPAEQAEMTGVSDVVDEVVAHYSKFNVRTTAAAVPTDLPAHVFVATAEDLTGAGPAVVIGLGASLDPRVAIHRAITEVAQARHGELWRFRNEYRRTRSEDVRVPFDHSALYWETSNQHPASCQSRDIPRRVHAFEQRSRHSTVGDLEYCVEALGVRGCHVVYADITTPDLADLGVFVVRVLITHCQPIHFGYLSERLGGSRLFDVPRRLGFTEIETTEEMLNRRPHPLS